jgi:hypothetical protein
MYVYIYIAPPQQGGYQPMGGRGDGGRGGYQPQGKKT